MAQWCVEEAATYALEVESRGPADEVSEARSQHERIMAAGRQGKLVTG